MENNILNELRTPVFLINKLNEVIYVNEIGEEFFGISSSILIGKKGKMIRKFSEKSRMQIENIYNKKVYINFTIKVRKWRNDENFIKKMF